MATYSPASACWALPYPQVVRGVQHPRLRLWPLLPAGYPAPCKGTVAHRRRTPHMPWMRSSLWIPLLLALPCGPCRRLVETHPCCGKKGGCQSVLWTPPGPSSWVGEAGKEILCTATGHRCSLSQPLILCSHCGPRREVVLLQKPRRQSLEKGWRGGHGP